MKMAESSAKIPGRWGHSNAQAKEGRNLVEWQLESTTGTLVLVWWDKIT